MFEDMFRKGSSEPEEKPIDRDILEMQKKAQEQSSRVLSQETGEDEKKPAIDPRVGKFLFDPEAIRSEGKKKGWTDTEIEAKIISEKAKIEAANRKVSGEAAVKAEEDSEELISREFQNRYDTDPEFRKSMDEQQKKREEAA